MSWRQRFEGLKFVTAISGVGWVCHAQRRLGVLHHQIIGRQYYRFAGATHLTEAGTGRGHASHDVVESGARVIAIVAI